MIPEFSGETGRVRCPFCSAERKKRNLKEMTVTRQPDGAVLYYCHHCLANGSVQNATKERSLLPVPAKQILNQELEQRHYDYLAKRGISKQTADKLKLFASRKYFHRLERESDCIGFPYFRDGSLVSAKYRSIPDRKSTRLNSSHT